VSIDYHSLDDGRSTNLHEMMSSAGDAMPSMITLPVSLNLDSCTVLLVSKVLIHLSCSSTGANDQLL